MNTERAKRKLSAILSADVKGYSRLMGEDEVGTVRTLKEYRELMSKLIKEYRGRVVDSPGDNVLAEFLSVVDALECSIEIQKTLKDKNAALPENRKMQFRIGVNLGDVIEDEDRVYGDGVNIAARIEGLAEPGGICISGSGFEQVRNKLPLGYEYLGEHTVKNIVQPIKVYRVLMEPEQAGKVIGEKGPKRTQWRWAVAAVALLVLVAGGLVWNFYWRAPKIELASKDKMAFPLPDKPSIAVLPFVNMSDDKSQEYLADGITENIISALSQVPNLFVIARNSTFTYKGKPVKVQQVAEELGVRYVLEGSVQKSGDTLRITAQLIDAITGQHVWSERYNRELKNIFALQDDITMKVITALQVKLTVGEGARLLSKGTKNLEAYLKYLQASAVFNTQTKEGYAQARRLWEEVIALDPQYAAAYSGLGGFHAMDAVQGFSKSPGESLKQALELIKKAVAMDESDAVSHSRLGWLYVFVGRQYDKAIAECERGIDLAPNSAECHIWMSFVLTMAGRSEEAVRYAEQALRLNPYPPSWWIRQFGLSNFFAGRYEEAIDAYKKSLNVSPKDLLTHQHLTTAYIWAGRHEEALAQAAEIVKITPKFSVEERAKFMPLKNQADLDRYLEGLRKAGLPDKPPLPIPDKPSIAVLPFVNMSDDPQQEYFSDGMTEDLITDLSKISGLFVVARNSTFVYKGKAVNVQQVSRELGVKYVLEGSVRRAGDQVRINAQLVDATTGQHLWAERYDGVMKDIFSLQDKINQKIVAALAVKLTVGEKELLTQKGTDDPAAYEEFLKGREHYLRNTKEDYAKAEVCFKKAIELDPNFSRAKASVALLYFDAAGQGVRMREAFKISDVETRLRARKYLTAAMKKPTSIAYQVEGLMDLSLRQHSEALSQIEKALALDPNDPSIHSSMSWVLSMSGRPAEGMEYAKSGMRLDPNNPARYLARIGIAHFCMGEYEEAATAIERALKQNPEIFREGTILASAYAHLGRNEEAKAACQTYTYRPHFHIYYWPFKDRGVANSFLKGLLKAGVEESRIEMAKDYLFTKDEQLTGDDLRAFYYPSTTAGYSLQGLDWSLEIAKDGNVTIRSPEAPGGMDKGRSWLEGDKLWLQFQNYNHGIAYCSTTFRNPTGTLEGKNQYISFNDVWYSRFSRTQ